MSGACQRIQGVLFSSGHKRDLRKKKFKDHRMAYSMNELGKNGWEGLISAGEWVGCWSAGGGQLYYTAFVFLGFSSSFFFSHLPFHHHYNYYILLDFSY